MKFQIRDTKEDLLKKKENMQNIEKILNCFESFYRSANSLVFQLNKRYIPKTQKYSSELLIEDMKAMNVL